MTLNQKRDRVAELLGWWRESEIDRDSGNSVDFWNSENHAQMDHPVPDTIDGIAALWEQHCPDTPITVQRHRRYGETWRWSAYAPDNIGIFVPIDPPTEYEARLTLLLAVLEAKGKK